MKSSHYYYVDDAVNCIDHHLAMVGFRYLQIDQALNAAFHELSANPRFSVAAIRKAFAIVGRANWTPDPDA